MRAGTGTGLLLLVYAITAVRGGAFSAGGIHVGLTETQTVASLTLDGFEFAPNSSSHVSQRLGDVTLRIRSDSAAEYITLRSVDATVTPISPLPAGENAAASIALKGAPSLTLERHFAAAGEGLRMWFVLRNNGSSEVELGAFGIAMVFMDMSVHEGAANDLDGLAATCSFVDPAIAGQHGFVSVTRMTGEGQVLLVVPENKTDFQAWRPMKEAGGGFFYELTSLSKAYAENEWVNASGSQWVEPTSLSLSPGKAYTFSYRLLGAESVRKKDDALAAAGFAVMQAVPSYSIATDMHSALLHVLPPRGQSVLHTAVMPTGAINIGSPARVGSNGFLAMSVRGVQHGRARVTVTYSDGSKHVASFYVLPPLNEHVQRYSKFLAETAWYDNVTDPFGRGHSVLAWNRQLKKHIGVGPWDNGYEDNRIFNNGLSDEAGAGTHVGFAAVVGGAAVARDAGRQLSFLHYLLQLSCALCLAFRVLSPCVVTLCWQRNWICTSTTPSTGSRAGFPLGRLCSVSRAAPLARCPAAGLLTAWAPPPTG